MGQKYVAPAITGYNVVPPPDDGTQVPANLLTWAVIKTKLADPVLALVNAINSALTNALDFSGRVTAVPDTSAAADHMRTIECAVTATMTLPDSAAIGAGYTVEYKNTGLGVLTIVLLTATDTLDGIVNGTTIVPAGGFASFKVRTAANGYFTKASGAAGGAAAGGSVGGAMAKTSVTAAANALTITLNQQTIEFRSPALGSGATNIRGVSTPISAVIPNGSTAGMTNGVAARIVVGAVDVGDGTVEPCWMNWTGAGKFNLDEDELITTTNIGLNAVDTWYSTTVRAGVPYRVIEYVEIVEATAGVWASPPTLVQAGGAYALSQMIGLKIRGVVPFNNQSAAYTTVIDDNGVTITHPTADVTARVFTIDSNANVPYPIGTAICFRNQAGAGIVTIAVTADTLNWAPSGTTGSRTLAASGFCVCLKETATSWMITGVGVT